MNNSEKILKIISNFIETGILTSQDAKKELINNLKFKRDDLIDKLELVSREEFNILKKIIEKQQKQIDQLKKKKTTKAKNPQLVNLCVYYSRLIQCFHHVISRYLLLSTFLAQRQHYLNFCFHPICKKV